MTENLGHVSAPRTFALPASALAPPTVAEPETLTPWLDVVSRATQHVLRDVAAPSPAVTISLLEAIDGASQALTAWKGSDVAAAGLRAALDTARVASKAARHEAPTANTVDMLLTHIDSIIDKTGRHVGGEAERYLRAALQGLQGPLKLVDPATAAALQQASKISYVFDYATTDMLGALAAAKATLQLRGIGAPSTALAVVEPPRKGWLARLFG